MASPGSREMEGRVGHRANPREATSDGPVEATIMIAKTTAPSCVVSSACSSIGDWGGRSERRGEDLMRASQHGNQSKPGGRQVLWWQQAVAAMPTSGLACFGIGMLARGPLAETAGIKWPWGRKSSAAGCSYYIYVHYCTLPTVRIYQLSAAVHQPRFHWIPGFPDFFDDP